MVLQQIVLGLYFFSMSNLLSMNSDYLSKLIHPEQKTLQQKAVDWVFLKIGNTSVSEVYEYCKRNECSQMVEIALSSTFDQDDVYAAKQVMLKSILLPDDVRWCLFFPSEDKSTDLTTKVKAYEKAQGMLVRDFCELYAECKNEQLLAISCVPLATRFLCSKEQLQCVRRMVHHLLIQSQDAQQYYDLDKNQYVPSLYELAAKEKELIVTLPEEFILQSGNVKDFQVVEKEHVLQKGFKASLALALNQGRYRIDVVDDRSLMMITAVYLLRLAGTISLVNFNIISDPAMFQLASFQVFGPYLSRVINSSTRLDRAMTLKYDKERWKFGVGIYSFSILLMNIMDIIRFGKFSLENFLMYTVPTKRDAIIFGGLFGVGMTWDYCKYGVTYGCKPTTLKQLWSDAQQHNKTATGKAYCSLL